MDIQKRDSLESFAVRYHTYNGKGYFKGYLKLNDGEYEISIKTKEHQTFDDAATELKELLIKRCKKYKR